MGLTHIILPPFPFPDFGCPNKLTSGQNDSSFALLSLSHLSMEKNREEEYKCSDPKTVKGSEKQKKMSEIAAVAGSLLSPLIQKEQQQLLIGNFTSGEGEWKKVGRKQWWLQSRSSRQRVRSQISVQQPQTYSASITTDIPLHESPSPLASFDRYLEDKPRVFQAIAPDKQRSQQLNEEEWRIQMLPINFFFLTVWPTVDVSLRCIAGGRDYPPQITKVMELQILRWELKGLNDIIEPSHFSLGVRGWLYADRGRGETISRTRTRLKGKLEIEISFLLPPVLAFVPEDLRKSVAQTVLTRLVDNMKRKVNGSLLSDYSKFKAEKP